MSAAPEIKRHPLRSPCSRCGGTEGRIEEKGAQDCVYCLGCDRHQYNAPRAETGKPVRHIKTREGISPSQRARILIVRANARCELCGTNARELHVAHLLSVDAGKAQGFTEDELNDDENLCAMCDACNLGMGKNPVPLRLVVAIQMARIRIDRERAKR
jgi:hypothetical protein